MELLVNARTVVGKKVQLIRNQGLVPGIVYGKHMKQPTTVQFDKNAFLKTYRSAGESTPVDLTGDSKELVLIHHITTDPVTDVVLHVDFLAVKADEKVRASVEIKLIGIAPVEKDGLARVQLVNDAVTVEALPRDLPHDIEVDISELKTLNDGIFVKDLKVSSKVEIIDDAEQPVVTVVELKEEAEEVAAGPVDAAGNAAAAAIEAEKKKETKE
ncbi:MAG: 50S ribosomal protein L25 [bacterium]